MADYANPPYAPEGVAKTIGYKIQATSERAVDSSGPAVDGSMLA